MRLPRITTARSHTETGDTSSKLDKHLLGGIAMGGMALLLGLTLVAGALRRRAGRAEIEATYAAAGGPLYTVFQLGCAGLLILAGLSILALSALGGAAR